MYDGSGSASVDSEMSDVPREAAFAGGQMAMSSWSHGISSPSTL